MNIILNSIKQAVNSSKPRKMEVYSAVSIFIFHTSCFDFTSEVKWKNNTIRFHSATKMNTNQYRNTVYACISLQFYLNYIWQKKEIYFIIHYSYNLMVQFLLVAFFLKCSKDTGTQQNFSCASKPLLCGFFFITTIIVLFILESEEGQDLLNSFIIQSLTRAKGRDECVNKASREW